MAYRKRAFNDVMSANFPYDFVGEDEPSMSPSVELTTWFKESTRESYIWTASAGWVLFATPAGGSGGTGATGATGPTGPTGPAGAQGDAGPAGDPGTDGAAGPTGPQGLTGEQGPAGAVGATGPTGLRGATGPTGMRGANASASRRMLVDASTTNVFATPIGGHLIFDNATESSATEITLSNEDESGVDVSDFWRAFVDTTSDSPGLLRIEQESNPSVWIAWSFTGINVATDGTYILGMDLVAKSQSSVNWGHSERVVVGLTRKGVRGATGAAGPQGAQGPAGPTGAQGPQGAAGANGPTGPTGPGNTLRIESGTTPLASGVKSLAFAGGDFTLGVGNDPDEVTVELGPGAAASVSPVVTQRSASVSVSAGGSATATATCNAGEIAIAGGGEGSGANVTLYSSKQASATSWSAAARNDANASRTLTAYVVCLQTPVT